MICDELHPKSHLWQRVSLQIGHGQQPIIKMDMDVWITLKRQYCYFDEICITDSSGSYSNPNFSTPSDENYIEMTFSLQCTLNSSNDRSWYLLCHCYFQLMMPTMHASEDRTCWAPLHSAKVLLPLAPAGEFDQGYYQKIKVLKQRSTMGHIYIANLGLKHSFSMLVKGTVIHLGITRLYMYACEVI